MQRAQTYPSSSLAFDWIMAVLAVILMSGVIQDGWAHSHGLVDQNFFTPWHAILYATMALNGIVLGTVAVVNLRRGHTARYALPFGYWMSLAGVIVFATGGAFDLLWHFRYGVETDINALISPSHLWLATGGALIFAGPLRSIAARYGPSEGGWRITGPAILSALAILTLIGFFTQYAQPIASPDEADIIGQHEAQNGGALYSVRSNGAQESRLLAIPGADIWGTAVSPDGKHVAYRVALARDPRSDIYVANVDGTGARRITHSGRHDTQPAWSPDGARIAFISIPAGTSGNYLLQTIRPDGEGLHTILSSVTEMQFPTWSPLGDLIAYQSRNGLHQQLAIVPVHGGPPKWLDGTVDGTQPAWSPKNQIAFVNADDNIVTGVTQILVRGGQWPAWSRDAKRLAFVRQAGGAAQVFVRDTRGHETNVSQLAGLNASRPSWTPSGLLFTATGRPDPATTFIGFAYSEDANLIESIAVTGICLLLIRRWRMPIGAMTFLLGLFAIAMAFQSNLFWEILAAIAAGMLADVAIQLLGERARSGFGFYALGFAVPAVLFTLYLIVAKLTLPGGLGWPPNMIFGSPIIAGFVGMLVAFCFAPPLRSPEDHARNTSIF